MRIILLIAFCSLGLGAADPELSREEARQAFELLNQIRTNPQGFTDQFPFLKDIHARQALHWNDTLARVAEARAMDLAKRNYFGHVDPDGYGANYYINKAGYRLESSWLKDPEANYFESLSAGGSSGKDAIERLLIDGNTPSLGHRKHLLGIEPWNASLLDIGIGYVWGNENTNFRSYACVIIAKHKW